MFAKTIIDSDAFLDMPLSTQALYFHLSMRADDDGFINNPKKIQRMVGCSDDDLKILCTKRFIIPFESGIVVIKHWKIHNYIRGDRKKPTMYPAEMAQLTEKDNGAYTLLTDDGQVTDKCLSSDSQMTDKCPHRLGKGSIGKDSIGESKVVEVSEEDNGGHFERLNGSLGKGVVMLTPEQDEALLECLGFDAYNHYIEKLATFIIEKGAKVSNHYATIMKWAKEDSKI